MKNHKLKVWSRIIARQRLWYTKCECGWEPNVPRVERNWRWWGRPTFDAAFALGLAHQKDKKEVCECG